MPSDQASFAQSDVYLACQKSRDLLFLHFQAALLLNTSSLFLLASPVSLNLSALFLFLSLLLVCPFPLTISVLSRLSPRHTCTHTNGCAPLQSKRKASNARRARAHARRTQTGLPGGQCKAHTRAKTKRPTSFALFLELKLAGLFALARLLTLSLLSLSAFLLLLLLLENVESTLILIEAIQVQCVVDCVILLQAPSCRRKASKGQD